MRVWASGRFFVGAFCDFSLTRGNSFSRSRIQPARSTPRIRSTSSMAGARKAAKTSTPKGGNARRVVTAVSPSSKKAAPKQQPAKKKPATLNERFTKLKQSGRDAQQQRNTTARYAATMAKRTGQSAKKFAVRHSARSPPRTRRPLLTCRMRPTRTNLNECSRSHSASRRLALAPR